MGVSIDRVEREDGWCKGGVGVGRRVSVVLASGETVSTGDVSRWRMTECVFAGQDVVDLLDVQIFMRVPYDVLKQRRHERHGYHTAGEEYLPLCDKNTDTDSTRSIPHPHPHPILPNVLNRTDLIVKTIVTPCEFNPTSQKARSGATRPVTGTRSSTRPTSTRIGDCLRAGTSRTVNP